MKRALNIISTVAFLALGAYAIVALDRPMPPLPIGADMTGSAAGAIGATQPTAQPRVAILTDEEQCLGYDREHYHRVVVYVSMTARADRSVDYEYAGVFSYVNDAAHDLGRGYRLVPLRRVRNADWFALWVRTAGDPITDSRERAHFTGEISGLVNVTSASLGLRCDDVAAKRRTVRP